jgi:tryptophanyl-tRNA synthetase
MSKSDKDVKSRIELIDPPEVIREKIKKAITDAHASISYNPEKRPGVSNLIEIHSACVDKLPEEIVEDCLLQALNKSSYKEIVSDSLIETLKPIRKKYLDLVNDKVYLNKIINESTNKANEIAAKNYEKIREIVGFEF